MNFLNYDATYKFIFVITCLLCVHLSFSATTGHLPNNNNNNNNNNNVNSNDAILKEPISFIEIQSRVSSGLHVENHDYARLNAEKNRMAEELANYLFEYKKNIININNVNRHIFLKGNERRRQMLSSYPETPVVQGKGECAKALDNWMSVCVFDDY